MTQAPATPSLVERVKEASYGAAQSYLNSTPWRGALRGDAFLAGVAWVISDPGFAALEAQQARIAELEGELKDALREVGKHARKAGEAIGRLEMSEAAGIVDGWRERAESAQALADRYEKALREACDLLAERTYGSPARSPGHNARLTLEAALSSQGRHEGGEG